jgi:hypothetical protein
MLAAPHKLIVAVAMAVAFCLSAAAQSLPAGRSRAELGLRFGLGYESETGLPWAAQPRLGLDLSVGRAYAYAETGQAVGRLDWKSRFAYRPLDSACLGLGLSMLEESRIALKAEALCCYRSFGGTLGDAELGAALGLDLGAVGAPRGIFFRGDFGYSWLFSDYLSGVKPIVDTGPILRLGLCAKPINRSLVCLSMSDFSPLEAGIFCKTSFEFSAQASLGRPTIKLAALIKYSDFFTLTSTVDGFAIRMGARLPLSGISRVEGPGLW